MSVKTRSFLTWQSCGWPGSKLGEMNCSLWGKKWDNLWMYEEKKKELADPTCHEKCIWLDFSRRFFFSKTIFSMARQPAHCNLVPMHKRVSLARPDVVYFQLLEVSGSPCAFHYSPKKHTRYWCYSSLSTVCQRQRKLIQEDMEKENLWGETPSLFLNSRCGKTSLLSTLNPHKQRSSTSWRRERQKKLLF